MIIIFPKDTHLTFIQPLKLHYQQLILFPGDLRFTSPMGEHLRTKTGMEEKNLKYHSACFHSNMLVLWHSLQLNRVLLICRLSQSKIPMTCINSKAFCLDVSQISFKERNTPSYMTRCSSHRRANAFSICCPGTSPATCGNTGKRTKQWGGQAGTLPRAQGDRDVSSH